jgi:hypothetical protein
MRLSSLSIAAVLLFSSIAFAQHHDTPSAPAPSPAPSAAPAPTPPPSAPSPAAASPSHAATESHVSAPAASIPENHSAPSVSLSNHTSTSVSNNLNSERATPVPHAAESDSRIVPERKISGEDKIVSAPRVGEESADKESATKPAESNLRRRICDDGPCKEPAPKRTPAESDLRRPCLKEPCTCSSGQTLTKGGCVTTVVNNSGQCQAGQVWNGGSCLAPVHCPANDYWNGVNCTPNGAECATINSRASVDINELRGLKGRTQQACSQDPSGQECSDLTQELSGATLRYRMLLNEASPTCRTTLPDPDSL